MTTPEQPGMAYARGIDSAELAQETVGQALVRASRDAANGAALVWLTDAGVDSMTWARLYARSCSAAANLIVANPSRARVALVAPNSVDWAVAMYGCVLAGMPVVPISPSVTGTEARHLLAQTRVGLILAAESVAEVAVHRTMCEVAAQLPLRPIVQRISDLSFAATETPRPGDEVRPDDESLLQHTSGTTGLPKAALTAHESVTEVAVFGVPDTRLGERVVAAVLPAAGARVDVDDLAVLAESSLSRHKRPAEWVIAASLPRTSTEKVRKHLLREWHQDGTLHARCGVAGPAPDSQRH